MKLRLIKRMVLDFRSMAIVCLMLVGCNACSNSQKLMGKKFPVAIEVFNAIPHCGGAAPMEGVEYPIMEPKSDGDYVVFKKGDKKKEVLRFRLNEEGKATFALVRGEYDLFRADKLMDLKSFIAENKYDNQFIKFSDDDCFQTWKNQVDLTFQVNGEKVQLINKIRCYVGDNPCAKYIGPPAP